MLIFDRSLVKLYRDKASFYNKADSFIFSEVTSIILDKLGLFSVNTGLILSIGCRTDYFSDSLLQRKLIFYKDQVVQCDISYHMLCSAQDNYRVVADDEQLPFCNETFDIVINNLCLHNVNNLFYNLLNIYNLMKDGGIFLASLFGHKTLYELKYSIIRAEMDIGIAPRIMPFINVQYIISLLQKSGYSNIVIDVNVIQLKYNDIYHLFKDLRKMGEGNVLYARNKHRLTKTVIKKIFEYYKKYFSVDEVSIPATFEIIILKANK
ncbi:methyltransferase domain-containing protein [Ehrlichia ruminantium]|uniref:Methyltransferase domain-containing protein n=1 Tax=Ehrlichia ruminantium TaxID=779 RepID=A0AAE6QA36_EHRRU|nr:class I SAM-dependent methyltransferase [Ehrlichia ruminantium]QGR02426.1 methyltransferase domain-containing protein [Ehrlichia ruminantium]QGR03345.1 methyltransferase domain-containing protein [Ehrlichia ruminantium]QGR04272.1 methyltransferase domain-containing protein [Ehrlichia ruminantium]